jgi:hypothetical protein
MRDYPGSETRINLHVELVHDQTELPHSQIVLSFDA